MSAKVVEKVVAKVAPLPFPESSDAGGEQAAASGVRDLVRYWFPLSVNWQVMAVEGPFIAALIGALSDSTFNLAAFGIAFAWAFIIETPVMGLLSASAALSRDWHSFLILRRFMWWVNGIATVLMLGFVYPPIFSWLLQDLLGQSQAMSARVHDAALLMILWPACIGFRRFYQGVSIAGGRPRYVAWGTAVRILCMAATGIVAAALGGSGAVAGCAALMGGVFGEAIAAWWLARPIVGSLRAQSASQSFSNNRAETLTTQAVIHFYTPIFLTIFLGVALYPSITFSLGMLSDPIASLASYPVLNGIWFFAAASTLGLQEASIALLANSRGHAEALLRKFAWSYGVTISLLLAIFSFSAVGELWLEKVAQLPRELQPLVLGGLQLSFMMPLLRALQSVQRGITVWKRRTSLGSQAAVVELAAVGIVILWCAYNSPHAAGVIIVACSVPLAAALATLFLFVRLNAYHRVALSTRDSPTK